MVDRGWGRVVNVSSVAAMGSGSPKMVIYSGVKSMLVKFTEGLAYDYRPHGINCTVSVPGATDTEMFAGVMDRCTNPRFLTITAMSPDTVARQIYEACMSGQRMVIHGLPNKMWVWSLLHTPAPVRYKLVEYTSKLQQEGEVSWLK